jgi:hypothetical protein
MEYTRSFKVIIEHDTNKQTEHTEYTSAKEACAALLAMLSDDERSGVFCGYCHWCGREGFGCSCRNDE